MSVTQEDAIRYFCQQKGITEEELGREISEGIQKYMKPFPVDTYKKGYQDAINKVYEWLASNLDCYVEVEGEHSFETNLKIHTDLFIEDLKSYMEEQQ